MENYFRSKIYNLDYEVLVENQENETRQLINYLNLDWDHKCLSPQDNKKIVATASSLQVRKKFTVVVRNNGLILNPS